MAEKESGWTKGLPKVDGDYFCRLNEHDLCPVSFRLENGKIYEYGCGGNLYSQYVAKWDDYEYLGPFTASDAEQLSELRKVLQTLRHHLWNQPDIVTLIDMALTPKQLEKKGRQQ